MTQLLALAITLALEVPIALLLGKRVFSLPISAWRLAAVAAATSLITHPVVWPLMTMWMARAPLWQRAVVGEGLAVAVEALIYWKAVPMTGRQGFVTSLCANAFSYGLGLVIGTRIYVWANVLREWLN